MSNFKNREISKLLASFDRRMIIDFTNYIAYKCSPNSQRFWKVLKRHYPKFDISNERLFRQIRKEQSLDINSLNRWTSDVYQCALEFLTLKLFLKDNRFFAITKAKALMLLIYEGNDVFSLYKKIKNQNDRLIRESDELDVYSYFLLNQKEFIHSQVISRINHHEENDSLVSASNYLDKNFFLLKLRNLVSLANRAIILPTQFEPKEETKFLEFMKDAIATEEHPLIHSYYLLFLAFRNIYSYPEFSNYKTYLIANIEKIKKDEGRQLLTFASNICSWNSEKNDSATDFINDWFELRRYMIEQGYLVNKKDVVLSYQYHQTIKSAIVAKKTEYAENFFKGSIHKVSKEKRGYVENYNGAYLYLHKGNHEKADQYLGNLARDSSVITNVYENVMFRTINLQVAYAMLTSTSKADEKSRVKTEINRFINYVDNQKVTPRFKETRINFAKSLKAIFDKKINAKSTNTNLKEEILRNTPATELHWLLRFC